MFKNRIEAGKKLAEKLLPYRGKDALVLALPRGGVVLGYEIAKRLALPLDIIAARKIGHPSNPEYAIGAVDENGLTVLNEREAFSVDKLWLKKEVARQTKEAKRRAGLYRQDRKLQDIGGKIAIIVDDGIATGFTMKLAVRAVKRKSPEKIVVAVPVAPRETLNELRAEDTDEIIVLEPPEEFMGAVGAHYREFEQVADNEVVLLLNKEKRL